MVGYRTENYGGSGIINIIDVMTFEIYELLNADIPYTLLKLYFDDDEDTKKILNKIINMVDTNRIQKKKILGEMLKIVVSNLSILTGKELSCCLWLTDRESVKSFYNGTDEDMDMYQTSNVILSDLGFQGILYAYDGEPKRLSSEDEDTSLKAIAYVDGSYNIATKEYGFGAVLSIGNDTIEYYEKGNDKNLVSMRNVAGEILGASYAIKECVKRNASTVDIYYDYEGIEKWCTGAWKAKQYGTKEYKKLYDKLKFIIKINFHKVIAHTGNELNEKADKLAKKALGIN